VCATENEGATISHFGFGHLFLFTFYCRYSKEKCSENNHYLPVVGLKKRAQIVVFLKKHHMS
jgi:hypothetical protein